MVSGTAISRTIGSVGCANVVSPPPPLWRVPPRTCQPPTPPPASPRVLIWRRRTESSRSTVVGFAFFGFLSVFASAALGACSVVAPAGAAEAVSTAFCSACFCSASLRSRSCLSRNSAACSSASCCSRRASSSRSSSSRTSTLGAAAGDGGVSAATAAAVTSAGSRFTKTRFLRTSTCTVRYLPVESVLRISLVCLRVSVILFLVSTEPCVRLRYSSSLDLSWSLSESSGTRFSTPAARSCSSSTEGGTFSSLANWATLVCATLRGLLLLGRLLGLVPGLLVLEPVRARGHDQLFGLVLVQLRDLRQLVDCQIRQVVAGLDAGLGELGGELRVHPLELQQLRVDALDLLFVGDRRDQQGVARAGAQLVHRALVERLDLEQLVDRDVRHLLERREALLDQDVGDLLVDVEPLHEMALDAAAFLLLLLVRFVFGHQVDLPAGELGGEPHVLAVAADRHREVLLVDDHVHGVLFLVDDDRGYLGGREGADHELRRIGRPKHDVHALAGELLRHGLHARAAHADAGADRVDALVVGEDRDLRAHAGVARRGLDLEQAFLDLRHLELEQLHDELRRGARQDQLRAARLAVDLHHPGAHAVADPEVLLRNHVLARQQRLEAAGLDDGAAALHALHRAGDQLVTARQEIVQDLLALGITDALQDHLLRRLRADAAELDRLERLLDEVFELGVRFALLRFRERDLRRGRLERVVGHHLPAPERLVSPGVAVDVHAHVDILGIFFLGRRGERHLERAEDDLARHVFLPCQHVHQHHQLTIPGYRISSHAILTIRVSASPARGRRAPARACVPRAPDSIVLLLRRAARLRSGASRSRRAYAFSRPPCAPRSARNRAPCATAGPGPARTLPAARSPPLPPPARASGAGSPRRSPRWRRRPACR